MFASSETFKKVYVLEIAFWTEGMPMSLYRKFLKKYHLSDLLPIEKTPEVIRTAKRDIKDLGRMGLTIIPKLGETIKAVIEGCTLCMNCVEDCPENAISFIEDIEPVTFAIDQSLCIGMACRRCERVCPEMLFNLKDFFVRQNIEKV